MFVVPCCARHFFRNFYIQLSSFTSIPHLMADTKRFQSFIFLDLETTGLKRPVEITEICLMAVQTDQLLIASAKHTQPRLIDKLNICVRPSQKIEPVASNITKIADKDLKQRKEFDKHLAKAVKTFILRQPQPSCLVAHSGDRFDFEILASEFVEARVKFPAEIQVSDSWKAFRKLHEVEKLQTTPRGRRKRENSYVGRVSFALGNLYKRVIGYEIEDSHTAEGDTKALLELVLQKPGVIKCLTELAHEMGSGDTNPGIGKVKKSKKNKKTMESPSALDKSDIAQVHEDYFSMLEEEGLLSTACSPERRDIGKKPETPLLDLRVNLTKL